MDRPGRVDSWVTHCMELGLISKQVIAFIQSILIQFAVDNGLGKHTDSIPTRKFNRYNKVGFSAIKDRRPALILFVFRDLAYLRRSNPPHLGSLSIEAVDELADSPSNPK